MRVRIPLRFVLALTAFFAACAGEEPTTPVLESSVEVSTTTLDDQAADLAVTENDATDPVTGPAAASSGLVVLTPIADNTIYEGEVDNSNGSGPDIFVGRTSGTVDPPARDRRGLVRFDVSSIPAGSTVTRVTLGLIVTRTPPAPATPTVSLHRLLVDFGEGVSSGMGMGAPAAPGDATWVHRIAPNTAWGAGGGLAGTDYIAAASGSDSDGLIGSTQGMEADVQAWVDTPASNFGWMLIGGEGTAGSVRGYASRENNVASARPLLSVAYLTPPDLTIVKSDQVDPVLPGGPITYTLSVRNGGETTASSIEVVDQLPAGVSFVSAGGASWACVETTPDTTITCTRNSSLAGGTTAPAITLVVTAPSSPQILTNTVEVSTTSTESNTGNNSASETTTVNLGADLTVAKTASPDPVEIGTTLTYTVTVNNLGVRDAVHVEVVDAVPAGLVSPNASSTDFTCGALAMGTITCTRTTLSAGESGSITITGTAPGSPQTLTNSVSVSSSTLDPNTANNSASIDTEVIPPPNQPPVADAGGPYEGDEGATINFDGSGSADPEGAALDYVWDLGDGAMAAGATPSHAYADDGSFPVTLTVSDGELSDQASTTVTVHNVPPTVAPLPAATLIETETYGASGSFTDPGADTWAGTVDYGDGAGSEPLALTGMSFELSHTYVAAGTFTLTVTVTDDDGGVGVAGAEIVVLTAAEAVRVLLIDHVDGLVATGALRPGLGRSLAAKLNGAVNALERDNRVAAHNQLEAFINEVEALVAGGQLDSSIGDDLIARTQRILAVI